MRARVEKRSVLGWNKSPSLSLVIPPNPTPYPSLLGTSFWRSTCANHVIWTNTIYQDEIFTLQYLIPHYPIKMRFSPIMHLSIMTSKMVFLMEPILVHMQIVMKMIQIIHLIMKLCMKMNMDTTFQLRRNKLHN